MACIIHYLNHDSIKPLELPKHIQIEQYCRSQGTNIATMEIIKAVQLYELRRLFFL